MNCAIALSISCLIDLDALHFPICSKMKVRKTRIKTREHTGFAHRPSICSHKGLTCRDTCLLRTALFLARNAGRTPDSRSPISTIKQATSKRPIIVIWKKRISIHAPQGCIENGVVIVEESKRITGCCRPPSLGTSPSIWQWCFGCDIVWNGTTREKIHRDAGSIPFHYSRCLEQKKGETNFLVYSLA